MLKNEIYFLLNKNEGPSIANGTLIDLDFGINLIISSFFSYIYTVIAHPSLFEIQGRKVRAAKCILLPNRKAFSQEKDSRATENNYLFLGNFKKEKVKM